MSRFTSLDAARKRAVRAVVNEIARRDSPTLVYVTHYLPGSA